jgi:hypothetical protein
MMLCKIFKFKRRHIAPVVCGRGGCLATDRITVDGAPVGYMYREIPTGDDDSGWRFFGGDEERQYMNNFQPHGVHDVNGIVDHDPDILPFLDAPIGSRFERGANGKFWLMSDGE